MKNSPRQNSWIVGLIFVIALLVIGFTLGPLQARAGSGPTETPEPTVTMAPTLTPPQIEPDPIIFDTPVPSPTTEIVVDPPGVDGIVRPWDNVPWLNRCLIGAVILGGLVFMFMVVYGIIQRMQPDERKN